MSLSSCHSLSHLCVFRRTPDLNLVREVVNAVYESGFRSEFQFGQKGAKSSSLYLPRCQYNVFLHLCPFHFLTPVKTLVRWGERKTLRPTKVTLVSVDFGPVSSSVFGRDNLKSYNLNRTWLNVSVNNLCR